MTLISSVDGGEANLASSWEKAMECRTLSPAPPLSAGRVIAPYPASYRCRR